jgi:hypothetical protein
MNVLVPSPEPFDDYHQIIRYEPHSNMSGVFEIGDSVMYFSSTHQKWVQTRVVRVRSGRSVDLSCRKNVDVSLIQRTAPVLASNSSQVRDSENTPTVQMRHDTVLYAIGTKVEYLSESMNGWIQSLVRGHNADGTYILNTKKTAHPSRVRLILVNSDSKKPVRQVHPISILSTVHVQCQSSDLLVYTAHILGALNLTFDHGLVKMKGLTGGQNEGIYFITSPQKDTRKYCLKVVKSVRVFPSIPTERERYLELMHLYPNELSRDKRISFPIRILQFAETSPYDVIVMECAKGERMAELVARLVSSADKSSLAQIFEQVGIELKKFHSRYGGLQHGDLQVSNIYVDQTSITFIDVGGMSRNGDDVDYFVKSITILAKTYGPEFEVIARSSFNRGYSIA